MPYYVCKGWFLQANLIVWIKRSDINPVENNCLFVHQNNMLRVYGTKCYRVYAVLPTDIYKGNLGGSLLLNINLVIKVNVVTSIKALCRIDSHAAMLKLSGIYHVVCYRKSLHHATLKWVVLQWSFQTHYLHTFYMRRYLHFSYRGNWYMYSTTFSLPMVQ